MDIRKASYKKTPQIVTRKIGDDFILVPIKQAVGDLQNIYTLSKVASRLWDLIDGKRTLENIHRIILDEFDVSSKELEKDLEVFFRELRELELIKIN